MEIMNFDIDAVLLRHNVVELISEAGLKDNLISLICHKDKIEINESNQVLFFSTVLDDEILESYENDLNEDDKAEITVDLLKLKNALSDLKGSVSFNLNIKNKKLVISSGIYKYNLAMKARKRNAKNPKLAPKNLIQIKGEELATIIKKCSNMDKRTVITILGETDKEGNAEEFLLVFKTRQEGTNDSVVVELNEFNTISYNIVENGEVIIDTVSTGLADIVKYVKELKQVDLYLQDSYPIVIQYELIEGHGLTRIGIAPRIE